MGTLKINCSSVADDYLRINSVPDEEGEINILITNEWDEVCVYIDKEKAAQIVNHLITVFDITPEQRNK